MLKNTQQYSWTASGAIAQHSTAQKANITSSPPPKTRPVERRLDSWKDALQTIIVPFSKNSPLQISSGKFDKTSWKCGILWNSNGRSKRRFGNSKVFLKRMEFGKETHRLQKSGHLTIMITKWKYTYFLHFYINVYLLHILLF